MTLISIEPALAHPCASAFRRTNDQLDSIRSGLRWQWSRLSGSWEGRDKHRVEAEVYRALSDLDRLSDRYYDLGVKLEAIVRRFETADENAPFLLQRLAWNEIVATLIGYLPVLAPSWLQLPWPFGIIPVFGALPVFSLLPSIFGPGWPPPIGLPRISPPSWLPVPMPGPRPQPSPSPAPLPVVQAPPASSRPAPVPLNPNARPADFSPKDGCAKYAQERRPDLGPTGGRGGAADYIDKFADKVFQIPDGDVDLQNHIAVGYAIVWPREHPALRNSAGWDYGHVAIVEEVGPDYVIVSQAGWGTMTRMKIPREQLASLYVIP